MKKHGTDLVSLIFGLIFAAFVVWWAVAYSTDFEADARWLVVGGLAALAAVILASTLTRRPKPVPPPPAEEPAPVIEETSCADKSPTEIIERDDWPRYDEPAEDKAEDKADDTAHDDTRDEPAKDPRP
jgi:hypothetical protein